jgi:Fe-S-cluster-containing dehydrogenase component
VSRAGFRLDLDRCTGCGACVLACRIEHGRFEGPSWRRLVVLNRARWSAGPVWHLSLACHHCEQPACVAACPSRAYSVRSDGAVILDPALCLGCRYCEMACPFDAPVFDESSGVMTKCDFCADRTGRGLLPACVAACPMDALGVLEAVETGVGGSETVPVSSAEHRPAEHRPDHLPESLPGFTDPAGCRPNLQLIPPAGGLRGERLRRFQEWLGT